MHIYIYIRDRHQAHALAPLLKKGKTMLEDDDMDDDEMGGDSDDVA